MNTHHLQEQLQLLETKTEGESFEDTIDYEKVNPEYPEPKEKKYITKPQSVIEYEAKKEQRYNSELISLIEYSFLCCIIIYSFLYPKEYFQTA